MIIKPFLRFTLFLGVLFILVSVCDFISKADTPGPLVKLRTAVVQLDRGTGSIIKAPSGKLYLLTNWHVCGVSQYKHQLFASFPNGEMVSGYVVKSDPTKDLCAAFIQGDLPSLKLAPKLLPSDKICTRGYPGHIPSESCGILGKTTRWGTIFDIGDVGECPNKFFQERDFEGRLRGCSFTYTSQLSTLYARPGSSGSPAVNYKGELIGVVSSWHPQSEFEAGLVTFKELKEFMKDL